MNKLKITRFTELDYTCNEAMNTLCANISFLGSGVKKIMVTSSQPNEGKSFLAMNMMRTLAGLGKNVVFVDADLRRSYITNKYGIRSFTPNAQGLAHYLAGMCEIGDVLYSTDILGAYMVPVGRTVMNSLPLLSASRLKNLLDTLARTYDAVIVDAPPLGILIDAAEIAKSCDGALLTVSYNKESRRELNEVKNQVTAAGCRVLGVVINNVTFDTLSSKRYHYRSYYSRYAMETYQPREREKQYYGKKRALFDRRAKTDNGAKEKTENEDRRIEKRE